MTEGNAPSPPAPRPGSPRFAGQVVYIYAFDVAYDMTRLPEGDVLGRPLMPYHLDPDKRGPRHPFFYRPQMITLEPEECDVGGRRVRVERTIKFFPVGAISIVYRVPFAVDSVGELVEFHEPVLGGVPLNECARRLAADVRDALGAILIRPNPQLRDEEAYTVFCLQAPLRDEAGGVCAAEPWLRANRRDVAALLTQEHDPDQLSEQEANDTAGRYLSYYESDLVVADWDAAFVVDEPARFEPTLHVMELANVQLVELEAYDRMLDEALQRAYRDVAKSRLGARSGVLASLREIRIDLTRLSDELSNNTKFFGAWHLARLYQSLSESFHLGDWHRTIDEKLHTLDALYQLLNQDRMNSWMLMLEVTVVVLFVIDLVILVAMSH
ncbi:MAG: hypothetical protein NTW19_02415 [Planctomycetota bacterium]|nr:hypothetical protein [Planctomycetota bacterium]